VSEPPFDEWLIAEQERLRELAVEGLGRVLAHESQNGSTQAAIQTANRLLALDPLPEVQRTLMRLYMRQGRRGGGAEAVPDVRGGVERWRRCRMART